MWIFIILVIIVNVFDVIKDIINIIGKIVDRLLK